MARRNSNTPTIFTSEIVLEGNNNTTSARVLFQNDRIIFQNANTGESLLDIGSDNSGVNFGSAINLPDGTILNTVNDVNVRDFELRASTPVVVYQNDTSPKDPGTYVVVRALLYNLTDSNATFSFSSNIEYTTDPTDQNILIIPVESFQSITTLTITAEADEFSESITITKLLEGGDGISIVVTNPSDVLAADSDGNVFSSDLENSVGRFILYKGAVNLTDLGQVIYRVDDSLNIQLEFVESSKPDAAESATKGYYRLKQFTGLAFDTRGGATLKAIYNGTTYETIYSVTKAIKGQPGQDGAPGQDGQDGTAGESPYLGIVTDENIFINTVNNNDVANIAEGSLGTSFQKEIGGETKTFYPLLDTVGQFQLLLGTEFVNTSEITFDLGDKDLTRQEKNGLYFEIEQDGNYKAFIEDRRVQEDNGWQEESEAEIFTLRATIDGIVRSTKKIKIQKTKIGKDGKTGPSLKLSVTPQFFRFNGEGNPVSDNEHMQIKAVPLNVADSYPGFKIRLATNPVITLQNVDKDANGAVTATLPVSNFIDSETGEFLNTAIITAVVSDADDNDILEDPVTIARTQSGTNAKSIVISSDSFVFPFKNNSINSEIASVKVSIKTQNLTSTLTHVGTPESTDTDGNTIAAIPADITIKKSDETFITIPQGAVVGPDDNGTYTLDLYLNNNDPNKISLGIQNHQDKASTFPVEIRATDGSTFDFINIYKLEASDGLSGLLTNEVDEIPAFADGNTDVADYSTLNGEFQVFLGTTRLLTDVTYSVTPDNPNQPSMIVKIENDGKYRVFEGEQPNPTGTIVQGVNTARAYLNAEYDGTTITKVFTVVKSKQGKNSINAVLSNETHTIRAKSNGELVSLDDLDSAGGTIRVYDGNDLVNSDCKFEVLAGAEDEDPIPDQEDNYTSNGLKFTVANTGVYTLSTTSISSWKDSDAEIFYVRVTYPKNAQPDEQTTLIKSYTITKSKGGADAKILTLSANRQIFTFDSDNNLSPSGQTITFTAKPQNIEISTDTPIVWSTNNSDFDNLLKPVEGNDYQRRISGSDFRAQDPSITELSVTVSVSNIYTDTVTIVKTKDGAAGSNAKTLKITSTSNVVLYKNSETKIAEPSSVNVFIDVTNITTPITSNLITFKNKDDVDITVPTLQSDRVDSNDKFFTITIGEANSTVKKSDFPLKISCTAEGVTDRITLNALDGGSSGITLLMSNESHTVPADPDGNVDEAGLADAGGVLELYEGINKKINSPGTTDTVKFSIKAPENAGNAFVDYSLLDSTHADYKLESSYTVDGLIVTVNQETGEYTISETEEGWGPTSKTIELTATYLEQIFTKKYTIVKSREGVPGSPGKDGKTVILESDQYFIPYKEDNTTSVQNFELTATAYNLDNTKTIIYEFSKGTVPIEDDDNFDINNNVLTIRDIPTPGETDTYFVNVYEQEGTNTATKTQVAQDSVSIIATKEGSDAITVSIPNDNHTFTAEADGTVTDPSNSGTKIQVLVGNTVLNALQNSDNLVPGSFKVTAAGSTGVTVGSLARTDPEGSNYKSFTMGDVGIAQNTNNGTITFTITLIKPNSTTSTIITRIASYSKSPKGFDGSNAKALFLQSDAQSFFLDKSGNPINNTINFSVIKENISGDVSYSSVPPDLLEFSYEEEDNEDFSTNSPWTKWENANGTGGAPGSPTSLTWVSTGYLYSYQSSGSSWKAIQRIVDSSELIDYISFEVNSVVSGYWTNARVFVNGQQRSFYDDSGNIYNNTSFSSTTPRRYRILLDDLIGQNYTVSIILFSSSSYYSKLDNVITYRKLENPTLSYTNFGSNPSVKVTATATEPATDTTEEQTYTSSITIGKVESGADGDTGPSGTDAKTVKLESNDYQIAYDAAGNNPNGAATNTIVLTATQQNHSNPSTVYYEFVLNGDTTPTKQNTTSNTYSYQLPTTKTLFGNPKTFTVNTREGSNTGTIIASDSISVIATKDGDNAFTIAVTNENHTFVADENNHVSDYTGGGTDIEVYYGNTQLTAKENITGDNQFKVTATAVGSNTITAGGVTVDGLKATMAAPTAMNDNINTASITLAIEVKGVGPSQTFYRTLSYSKSRKGTDGATGASSNTVFLRSASEPTKPSNSTTSVPTNWEDDPAEATGTNPLWASQGTKDVGATQFVWGKPYKVEGSAVAEITIYKKASTTSPPSGGSYNFTNNTFTEPTGWSATLPEISANGDKVYASNGVFSGTPTQTSATTTWSTPVVYAQRTDGEDGADGVDSFSVEIDKEIFVLQANELGWVSDYSNTTFTVRAFFGDTELDSIATTTLNVSNGQFRISVSSDGNIQKGTENSSATSLSYGAVSGFTNTASEANLTLSIQMKSPSGLSKTITKIIKFSKINKVTKLTDANVFNFSERYVAPRTINNNTTVYDNWSLGWRGSTSDTDVTSYLSTDDIDYSNKKLAEPELIQAFQSQFGNFGIDFNSKYGGWLGYHSVPGTGDFSNAETINIFSKFFAINNKENHVLKARVLPFALDYPLTKIEVVFFNKDENNNFTYIDTVFIPIKLFIRLDTSYSYNDVADNTAMTITEEQYRKFYSKIPIRSPGADNTVVEPSEVLADYNSYINYYIRAQNWYDFEIYFGGNRTNTYSTKQNILADINNAIKIPQNANHVRLNFWSHTDYFAFFDYLSFTESKATLDTDGRISNAFLPQDLVISNTVTANSFSGNGASLTSLDASNISTGRITDSRLPTIMGQKTFDIALQNQFVGYFRNTYNGTGAGIAVQAGNRVSGNSRFLVAFYSSDGAWIGGITHANGTITYSAFTGVHNGLLENKENAVYTYGEILKIKNVIYEETPEPIYICEKTYSKNEKSVIGIYHSECEKPEGENSIFNIQIASVGNGHILVNSQNGNIETGDYICSSDAPGIGMKQDDDILRNYTVAKATESVDWSQEESDTKLISCTYHCG